MVDHGHMTGTISVVTIWKHVIMALKYLVHINMFSMVPDKFTKHFYNYTKITMAHKKTIVQKYTII